MADAKQCPHVQRCELFPRLRLGGALGYCLDEYCYGEHTKCARFRFAKEHGRRPSPNLLPNGSTID